MSGPPFVGSSPASSSSSVPWQTTPPDEAAGSSTQPARPLATGLAVITYWAKERRTPQERAAAGTRIRALRRTLSAFTRYAGVFMRVILVTNRWELAADGLVSQQVVVPNPTCGPPLNNHPYCLPWEAVRLLSRGRGRRSRCDMEDTQEDCNVSVNLGVLPYDYYIYTEDDVEISPSTFEFWRTHVDSIQKLGWLLVPHRREVRDAAHGWEVLPDCFTWHCIASTDVWRHLEVDDDASDQVYVHPMNAFSGCWLMTRAQFEQYLTGKQWDYGWANRHYQVGIRELAASGLIWDPRYGWRTAPYRGAVTHLRLPVYHLAPQNPVYGRDGATGHKVLKRNVSLWERKVAECVSNPAVCPVMKARKLLPVEPTCSAHRCERLW